VTRRPPRWTRKNSPLPLNFWKKNEPVLDRIPVLDCRRRLRRHRLAFVLPALLRARAGGKAVRRDVNIAVYRDQMKEMEADRANGLLSEAQYQSAKLELEARLADDALTLDDTPNPAVSAAASWVTPLAPCCRPPPSPSTSGWVTRVPGCRCAIRDSPHRHGRRPG